MFFPQVAEQTIYFPLFAEQSFFRKSIAPPPPPPQNEMVGPLLLKHCTKLVPFIQLLLNLDTCTGSLHMKFDKCFPVITLMVIPTSS